MFKILQPLFYEFMSYFVPTPNPYIRVGKCLQCGKCCREIYSRDTFTEKEFKFMQFIYPPYRRFYIKNKDNLGNLVFACKYVQPDGKCAVYAKRPKFCKTYPIPKHNYSLTMPEGCGYKFVKKEFKEFLENAKNTKTKSN